MFKRLFSSKVLSWLAIATLASAMTWLYLGIYQQAKTVKIQEEALAHISGTLLNYQERFEQIADHSNQMVASIKALDETLRSDSQAWRLMQAQNYIESAMIQANLLKDPKAAISFLAAAQINLKEINDSRLTPLLQAIERDILMLNKQSSLEVTNIILTLADVMDQVPQLPHKIRIKTDFKTEAPPTDKSNTAWQELKSLVRIQRHDRPVTPYFAKEDIELINENLSLMLGQAGFAAAKGQNVLYKKELMQAQNWIKEYYDLNDPAVERNLKTLKSLAEFSVEMTTPLQLETVTVWGNFVHSKKTTEQ